MGDGDAKPRKMRHSISMWPSVGLDDLCKMFGLTRRRVNQLVDDGVITRVDRGEYNIVNAVLGYITFLRDDNKNRTKTASASALNEAKARLVDAQVEEKTGKIRSQIRQETASLVSVVIGELMADIHALPARITRNLDERKRFEDEIERLQRAAFERLKRQADGADDSDGDAEASFEADD